MKKIKINTIITRDFLALVEPTGNIYKSVAIISKRARQIALQTKEELHTKLVDFVSEEKDELEDEEKASKQEQAEITKLYERLPKPTTLATEEFLEDRLTYRMPDQKTK
jgi:DNA-directed RNA polymerase subunit K/omega